MYSTRSTDVTSASVASPFLFRITKYSGNGYVYGGSCSMGQLLSRGWQMSLINGQNLRQAYGQLLPSSYLADPSKVFLQSDDSDRVTASGNAVFTGIFSGDQAATYSSNSIPVVDWFVPDLSPLNPGDFCSQELKGSSISINSHARIGQPVIT
jgi:hypothetical protein